MKILVINTGSATLKYQLFDMALSRVMAGGLMERIGEGMGSWTHVTSSGDSGKSAKKQTRALKLKSHGVAMYMAINIIADPHKGVIKNISEINAVGHRVVHGGEMFNGAVMVDECVKKAILDFKALAPLHNPSNLTGIEVARQLLPDIPNVAVFDTQFHRSLPPKAFLYGLPHKFYTKYKVRRYGFHGISHKYLSQAAARLLDKDIKTINLITLHLGNGCSACAVEKGKSIDTSMGMTPLAGLMMGTRTGDMDPAVIRYLMKQTGKTIDQLDVIFNRESGLKGICRINDFRDIHKAAEKGDPMAALAVEMFCYQAKKYVGAYTAILERVDAFVFSGGVGENDAVVREKICSGLSGLGIRIDAKKNLKVKAGPYSIHSQASATAVWVIPTNEELQIAKEVSDLVNIQTAVHR